jgi:hypothetical protein
MATKTKVRHQHSYTKSSPDRCKCGHVRNPDDKGGRPFGPSKLDEVLIRDMLQFFSVKPYTLQKLETEYHEGGQVKREITRFVPSDLPTMIMFAREKNLSRDTLRRWAREGAMIEDEDDIRHRYSVAYKNCLELQEAILLINTLRGLYTPSMAIFMAKNVLVREDGKRWSDRQEVDASVQHAWADMNEDQLDDFIDKRLARIRGLHDAAKAGAAAGSRAGNRRAGSPKK